MQNLTEGRIGGKTCKQNWKKVSMLPARTVVLSVWTGVQDLYVL